MSDKEVKIRITGDVSDLQKKLKSIENTLNNLGKNSSGNNKLINNLIDGIDQFEKRAEDAVDVLDDIYDSTRRAGKSSYMAELAADLGDVDKKAEETVDNIKDINKSMNSIDVKPMNNITKSMTDMQLEDRVKDMQDFAESVNSIKKVANLDFGGTHNSFDKITKESGGMIDNIASGFTTGVVASNVMAKSLDGIAAEIKDVTSSLKGLDALTSLKDKVQAFDAFSDVLTRARRNIEELNEAYEKLEQQEQDLIKKQQELQEQPYSVSRARENQKLEEQLKEVQTEMDKYTDLINKAELELKKLTKEENKYADELNSKIDRYDRLSEKINKIIDDENQNVLVQKRLAQVYEQTAKSMKNMYDDVEYDKVSKDLERLSKEARDYVETTSLMNFDTLGDDIKKLTKHINEKIEKTKELTAADKAMDDQTRSTVYHLESEAEALKEYADTAGYAFKRIEEKAGTDEEWQIIGNIKALEKSLKPEKIREYNEAIAEYFHIMNETNGQISKSFMNEDGSFSVAKFIAILERAGRPASMLAAEYKNIKNKTLEYLKIGDEESQQIAKIAKERLESIATIKKEAQALKEKSETEEKDAKAQLESLKTQKQDIDAKLERIKSEIKLAEALKESGEATEETNKKHQAAIELQQELRKMSDDLASQMVEADKKATKAKQDLLEATEKLNKAKKDEARAQEVLDRYDQDTRINNAKKKLEEVEISQRAAKAKLEEAQEAERLAKATRDEYNEKKRLIALKEKGDMDATADETSSKKFQVAIKKATKTQKEYNEAIEKTKKAQQDYEKSTREVAEAKERLEKAEQSEIDNKREHVKALNEQTKALKKYGQAVDDINLDEIRNLDGVDKTLATKLKDLFPENLPDSFKQIGEYIKAAFSEFKDLEFGNAGDLLKDVGKSLFNMLPGNVKAVTAVVGGLTIAINKLYEAGKRQFFEGLSNIGNKLKPVINALQSFGREAVTAFESITGTNIDLSSLMELGPNFEYQMQKVGAIAGSTDKQLAELTKTAEHLGGVTQYTASDVGEAFEYMAMAGYSTEDMLNSINGVLSLSIASGTGLAKTSDIVTDYMTAMGMEASNTGEFVDKLAATITSSNTTVELFGNSMKQVGSQAGSLGITMTDISTAIGLAANAGVKGSKAGTALKNVLANMASPTEKQAKALQKLGFSADEAGSYLETTKDGAVDLEKTMMKLMTATKDMDRTEQAAILTTIAGKEAMAGLFAIINQGPEAWEELSTTIENSTGNVQYWNECMSIAGKSGKAATDAIKHMKEVFAETESEAINLGLSTEDLSHAIAVLGKDGKVSTDNIKDLFAVIENMNTATGKALDKWIELGAETKNDYVMGFDYDGTIAKLTADTQGLTQAQKEELQTRLKNVDTFKQAEEVARNYQKELNRANGTQFNLIDIMERNSLAAMDYTDKLGLLRDAYKQLGWKEFDQAMFDLGLGDSLDEIHEIVKMSEEDFNAYTENLKTVKGMAEQLANAMDEVTKASLLNLASAIENVAIAAFNNLKEGLKGACNAVNEFFDIWHNGDDNVFTFDGLEGGLRLLESKIRSHEGSIQNAIVGLFDGANRFINSGSLRSILEMGTSVVTGICKGIQEAKNNGTLDAAISGAIKKIATWIKDNGPMIEEAGLTILESLKSGIESNAYVIEDALDVVCSIINSWASSSAQLEDTAALFADKFVSSFAESTAKSFGNKANEIMTAITKVLNPGLYENYLETQGVEKPKDPQKEQTEYYAKGGWFKDLFKKGWESVKGWFTGEAHAAELGEEVGTQFTEGYNNSLSTGKETTVTTANEIGTGISEGIMSKLETMDATQLQALGTELTNLQTTTQTVATGMGTAFTTIQNSARTSFMGFTNIVRNQLLNCTNIVRNQALNMSNIFRNQFVNMSNIARNQFVNLANIVRNQMVNAANIVRNQAVNMANIFRNQFTSMSNVARNQMVNVSNIIRNQSVSWSNIIRNQVTSARNAFTSQMISMAAVARTQMTNVSNIVRNQAISWSNVVRNQSANMKAAFSTAFSGLAAVAARGMASCLSTVRSYMSQIRAATSQTMTMNFRVNKTMTTTNVTKNVTQGLASTMSSIARHTAPIAAPQSMAIGGSVGTNRTVAGLGSVESLQLSVPLTVDGRELARATASYNQAELAKLSKRNNRRRGE